MTVWLAVETIPIWKNRGCRGKPQEKKRMVQTMKKSNIVANIVFIISVLLFVWFLLSFVEVTANNLTTAEYSVWNLFEVGIKFAENIKK